MVVRRTLSIDKNFALALFSLFSFSFFLSLSSQIVSTAMPNKTGIAFIGAPVLAPPSCSRPVAGAPFTRIGCRRHCARRHCPAANCCCKLVGDRWWAHVCPLALTNITTSNSLLLGSGSPPENIRAVKPLEPAQFCHFRQKFARLQVVIEAVTCHQAYHIAR